jgi:hypothetical protein
MNKDMKHTDNIRTTQEKLSQIFEGGNEIIKNELILFEME